MEGYLCFIPVQRALFCQNNQLVTSVHTCCMLRVRPLAMLRQPTTATNQKRPTMNKTLDRPGIAVGCNPPPHAQQAVLALHAFEKTIYWWPNNPGAIWTQTISSSVKRLALDTRGCN
eukprot:6106950-Amphidinium_carterae.1